MCSPAAQARAADPPGFSRQVRANMFILTDAKGRMRGEWVIEPKTGMAILRMAGAEEKGRIAMSCMQDGSPVIAFMNPDGKMAIELSADAKRGAQVRLYAPDGLKTRLLMQVMEGMKGPTGKRLEGGVITAIAKSGQSTAFYVTDKTAGIGIMDAQNKPIWTAP